MIGAGLLAKKAVERGLTRKPWVKTSLAPGSKVVTEYLREGGARHVSRSARLQPGRLRLHDLHRQQRAAARRRVGRGRGAQPGRRLGAERQPQLRGPHPAAGARELPGVAAAGRRLRARRADDDRSDDRAARHGTRRQRRSTCATSGRPSARFRKRCCARSTRRCSASSTPTCSAATSAGSRCTVPTGDRFAWEPDSTYIRNPPFFEGITLAAGAAHGHRRRARAGAARRQHHDRPHLAGRLDQEGQPGREVPDRARRPAGRLQLLRRAARQPRSDDARHVRQHPPAQPARARHRRRLDDVSSPTAR